jgi:hypothetical protein
MGWLRKNAKNIALALSLVLNALGGTGVIPPVVAKTGSQIINGLAE